MQTFLVSIISEQTVPNYLFIKEFQPQVEKFIFISTEQMEQRNKTEYICSTAGIEKERKIKVLVSDNLLHEVQERLRKISFTSETNFIVNLTGGTKMMSIAVWHFFQQFPNVRFFYVPIHKNTYVEVFDDKPSVSEKFTYNISLDEYLKIYNIRTEKSELIFNETLANDIFNDVKSGQYDLDKFPQKKLKTHNIPSVNKQLYTKWFEEYVYYKIKKELCLEDNKIATGIKLFDTLKEKEIEYYQNDNEVDVIFLYNNNPYIIECKFGIGKEKINTTTLGQIIYKLSSLNKRFGLSAQSTIFTLSDLTQLRPNAAENLKRRCEIAGVYHPLFDRGRIVSSSFIEFIKSFLK